MFSAEYKESSFLSNPASISKSSTFSWPRSVKETFLLFSSMTKKAVQDAKIICCLFSPFGIVDAKAI